MSRRGYSSSRGSFYRGSRGSYRGYPSSDMRYSSSDRYHNSRGRSDDYRSPKSYRSDFHSNPYQRDNRSPDRKRYKSEAMYSRHESSSSYASPSGYGGGSGGGGGRYTSSPSYVERRSAPGERPRSSYPHRESYRRPSGHRMSSRGGYRGRITSRNSSFFSSRERPFPPRRRLLAGASYSINKRFIPSRAADFARRLKISKLRSAIAASRSKNSDEDEEVSEVEEDNQEKSDNDEENKSKSRSPRKDSGEDLEQEEKRKNFIKLVCPHCPVKCITFGRYEMHLQSRIHIMAMRRLAIKQKAILLQMRQAQRATQNDLEKDEDTTGKTNFCLLCKLNYKQPKSTHQLSESHKNMKKFLMPFCKICRITFRSPMIYESHIASITHLKRKHRSDKTADEEDPNEEELEDFTTIDSIGEVDEEAAEKSDDSKSLNVGIEKILKVESYFCDLCKIYLPRCEESEVSNSITKHCKLRSHMQKYIRFKERENLEIRAKKLQRKENAEKEKRASNESMEEKDNDLNTSTKDDDDKKDDKDEKMWEDLDKDLGEILVEAEDDEEEEEVMTKQKGRYDRFKGDDKTVKEGEDQKSLVANGKKEAVENSA